MLRIATAALLLVACNADARRKPIASCADDLAGTWSTPAGRWMMLDNGKTLEAYPLFDDSVTEGAPRLIDLKRGDAPNRLEGELKRRFMRRADECESRAPVHVTRCEGDALQVVRGDVTSPLTFAPCSFGQSVPSHVETWHR